ncbi:MAG: 50S ribosomal protein L15 [Candidatus Paceibacterota bacterium]
MQIHNIKRKTANKKVMTVGRGGKRGKTSGRGGKGQTARAGHKIRPEWRDFIKRMPKLRGYSFQSITGVRNPVVAINLDLIEIAYKNGETVKPSTLFAKGVIEQYKGKNQKIKILGTGEITKKVSIVGCTVSESAKTKIEKAGGSVK